MGMELIERIRERAYRLWEAEGCEHGRDMEYWFRAEAQVSAEQAAGSKGQTQAAAKPAVAMKPEAAAKAPEAPKAAAVTAPAAKKPAAKTAAPAKTKAAAAAAGTGNTKTRTPAKKA